MVSLFRSKGPASLSTASTMTHLLPVVLVQSFVLDPNYTKSNFLVTNGAANPNGSYTPAIRLSSPLSVYVTSGSAMTKVIWFVAGFQQTPHIFVFASD